jgi:hypothetical protein
MNVTETKALQKVKEILTDAGIEATTMRNSNLKIGTVNIEFQEWEGDRGLMENWFCATYIDHDGEENTKMERFDKYFSSVMFAEFFIQRKEWLQAPTWVKQWCFNQKPMLHPSQYRAGMVQGTIENALN